MKPRILVVDDDPLYTEAATAILAQDGRVEVVGCAENGREAVERALLLEPATDYELRLTLVDSLTNPLANLFLLGGGLMLDGTQLYVDAVPTANLGRIPCRFTPPKHPSTRDTPVDSCLRRPSILSMLFSALREAVGPRKGRSPLTICFSPT